MGEAANASFSRLMISNERFARFPRITCHQAGRNWQAALRAALPE